MKPLEKIIVWTLTTASVLSNGCSPLQTKTSQNELGQEPAIEQKVISTSDIKISKITPADSPTVDDLIKTSEDYIDYLTFRNTYSNYGNQIILSIKDNSLDKTQSLVKELAHKLEQDPSPYAKDYLEKVKNFNYLVYEVYEEEESKEKRKTHDVGSFIAMACAWPLIPLNAGISLVKDISSGGKTHYTEELLFTRDTETKMIGKKATKIAVIPYTGQRTILESDIPYSRIQEELRQLK